MILKGSQRGGGGQLGLHLIRTDENDHVEVFQIRGFIGNNVVDALREAYALSRGTKCEKYLYSLSLSPPQEETVPISVFEGAINEIEDRLGLKGLPRIVVFHEKAGRRHCHCVWSRINPETMTGTTISFDRLKLRETSRKLYLENNWKMPPGLTDSEARNPLNFSREEWQQALRAQRDPTAVKKIFQDCWGTSDSLKAFQHSLEMRGFYLAQGDRRGHVAVDIKGEVYPISRWTGINAKDVRHRLGDPEELRTVTETQQFIGEKVSAKLTSFHQELAGEFAAAMGNLQEKRRQLVSRQR